MQTGVSESEFSENDSSSHSSKDNINNEQLGTSDFTKGELNRINSAENRQVLEVRSTQEQHEVEAANPSTSHHTPKAIEVSSHSHDN